MSANDSHNHWRSTSRTSCGVYQRQIQWSSVCTRVCMWVGVILGNLQTAIYWDTTHSQMDSWECGVFLPSRTAPGGGDIRRPTSKSQLSQGVQNVRNNNVCWWNRILFLCTDWTCTKMLYLWNIIICSHILETIPLSSLPVVMPDTISAMEIVLSQCLRKLLVYYRPVVSVRFLRILNPKWVLERAHWQSCFLRRNMMLRGDLLG